MENYLQSTKKSNKNNAYFYRLFSKKEKRKGKQSHFSMFGNDFKNEFKNIFQCLVCNFFLLLLGSKTLGSKCIRTSMCNVGKP